MIKKLKWTLAGLGLGALYLLSACSVPARIHKKTIETPPVAYKDAVKNEADSLSMAQLHYKSFFTDSILVRLIDEVLEHNLDYKIALEQVNIAQAQLRMARGALLPSVNAGLQASGTHYGKYTIDGVGNFDTNLSDNIEEAQKVNTRLTPNYWLGLNASWEIDLWGRLKNLKTAAQNRYLASEQGMHLLRSALVTRVASLYYDLVALDKQQVILVENIQLQKEALEIVSIQKEVGRATELAVQQFIAQLANSESALLAVQQEAAAIENELLLLMGKYEGEVKRATSILPVKVAHQERLGNPAQLLQYRPDIAMRYHELEASHADAKAVRAAFFPTLSISAYGAFNAFNSSYLFSPSSIAFQLLGNLVAPVFQQHQLKSQFRIANAEQEMAFLRYQNEVISAFQEVNSIVRALQTNERIVALKNKEVEALTKSIDVSQDLYLAGYATYLEIINAQKSKIEAQMAQIVARRDQALMMIKLYKALGGGWQ